MSETTPGEIPDLVQPPTPGGVRRGGLNPRVVAIGGGALAAVVAGGAILMMSGGGDEPGPNGDPTARPTGSAPTAGPSATPGEPSPSAYATVPYDPASRVFPAAFDDGIDPSDLPPLAERPGPSYPPAHVMQPWVWDHVGPGWGVALFCGATQDDPYGDYPVELYLASPEGIYFDVVEVTGGMPVDVTLEEVSREARRVVVMITSGDGTHLEDYDLVTGELLDDYAYVEEFGPDIEGQRLAVGTFAGDHVLWRTLHTDPDTWYADTWTFEVSSGSGPVEPLVLPTATLWLAWDGYFAPGYPTETVRELLFVEPLSIDSPPPSTAAAYRLDVATRSFSAVTARYPSGVDACDSPGTMISGASDIQCRSDASSDADQTWHSYVVTWDGATAPVRVADEWRGVVLEQGWADMGFAFDYGDEARPRVAFVDVASGVNRTVFEVPDPSLPNQWFHDTLPFEFADDAFLLTTGYTVVGYDRSTGGSLELSGARMPDTGAPAGLFGYLAFGQFDE